MNKLIYKIILVVLALVLSFALVFVCFACDSNNTNKIDEGNNDEELKNPRNYDLSVPEELLLCKTEGFVKGVCHPSKNYQQIKDCNIGWIRVDIPFLYNDDGTISQSYLNFKTKIQGYVDNGIKVMAVTPYPKDYIAYGIDPRIEENEKAVCDIAEYYVEDMKGLVAAYQITNEMGVQHFTYPLTMKEAARFIGIQLEAMYPLRGNTVIGYNCGGIDGFTTLNVQLKPFLPYCDYVGVDIYLGCFESIYKEISAFSSLIKMVRDITKKPIFVNEFGYIGLGQRKTAEQKAEIMQGYGYNSEAEAKADIVNFVKKLTPELQSYVEKTATSEAEMANILFETEMINHIYLEIQEGYQLNEYQHTPEGQAEFFTDSLELLNNIEYVCGAFVYCYSDSDRCYLCGQLSCPVETAWGLVDLNGNPKPSYYAVQEGYGKIDK